MEVIGWQLPALKKTPVALDKCYRVFARLFEPSLVATPAALEAILAEVALQDPRAKSLRPADLTIALG